MAAYIIALVEVRDRERFAEYMKVASEVVAQFDGKFLARGGRTETLEGPEEKRRVVVLEFPTYERAKAFYDAEEYKEPKRMRAEAATATFILVEGLKPGQAG